MPFQIVNPELIRECFRQIADHWREFALWPEKGWRDLIEKGPNTEADMNGRRTSLMTTALRAYAQHELRSLLTNTLISDLEFFPALTSVLLNAIINDAAEATGPPIVTFFSTLLPRHYFLFPHARRGSLSRNGGGSEIDYAVVCYPEPFVDKYRGVIRDLVKSSNVLVRRFTVVDEDSDVGVYWARREGGGSVLAEPPRLLAEFLDDAGRYLREDVPTHQLFNHNRVDIIHSLGLRVPDPENFTHKSLANALPDDVKAIHLFPRWPGSSQYNGQLPNLVEAFSQRYHSQHECHLAVVRYQDSGGDLEGVDALHGRGVTVHRMATNSFDAISPDFVHIRLGERHEVFVVATISLANRTVMMRYLSNEVKTDEFDRYSRFLSSVPPPNQLAESISMPRLLDNLERDVNEHWEGAPISSRALAALGAIRNSDKLMNEPAIRTALSNPRDKNKIPNVIQALEAIIKSLGER